MVYGVTWRDEMYMVWPGGHGIWYGLADMAWYMTWSGGHGMVWPGGHRIVYVLAW